MADLLPSAFPPTGARFRKPYTEIEYRGKVYPIKDMVGGHNGIVAKACIASPPIYDAVRKRWVVPITNNLIDIDLADQPAAADAFEAGSPLRQLHIRNNEDVRYASSGLLVTATEDPDGPPAFPVDCEFQMYITVSIPRRPKLMNVKPFRLVARGLTSWPPPVGTVYDNIDGAELVPARLARLGRAIPPVARILAGDRTILTEVFAA
jgi:hypothetical protein